MMEMKVVLSYILRNFTFESSYGEDEMKISFDLVPRAKKPIEIKFKLRNAPLIDK